MKSGQSFPRVPTGARSHPSRGGWIEIPFKPINRDLGIGPTPHGVGGLKYTSGSPEIFSGGPTPHGVGGLKSLYILYTQELVKSHPSRGGWIEIGSNGSLAEYFDGPTPHGVGGLKSGGWWPDGCLQRPTPHGVGGLKWDLLGSLPDHQMSHPSRGGWIEISAWS